MNAPGEQIIARLAARQAARAVGAIRLCVCGCGAPVTSRRTDARYATSSCRAQATRRRQGAADASGARGFWAGVGSMQRRSDALVWRRGGAS